MTKEQLTKLDDIVRIPAEEFRQHLIETAFLPKEILAGDDGGIVFLFENTHDGIVFTADVEIEANGTVSASVIPYTSTPEGLELYCSEFEPVDVWEVEEEPPFEETLLRIRTRLYLVPAC